MDKTTRLLPTSSVIRGGQSPLSGGDSVVYGDILGTNSRSGKSNPGWRRRISEGHFVASNYSTQRYDVISYKPTSWSVLHASLLGPEFPPVVKIGTAQVSGWPCAAGSLGLPSDPFVDADRAQAAGDAYNRLLAKIRKEHSEANGLLMLGELRETLKMIRRPAGAMRDAFKLFTARTKREAALARTRRAFMTAYSGLYLEWAFGWKPLMSDVEEAAKAATRFLGGQYPRKVLSATGQAPSRSSNSVSYLQQSSPDVLAQLTSVQDAVHSVQAKAYLDVSLKGPSLAAERLVELSGFTLENFIPTVYNLIPFSFLLDYVSNLGDVIEGACTAQSDVKGVVTTARTVSVLTQVISRNSERAKAAIKTVRPTLLYTVDDCPPAECNLKLTKLTRTVTSSVPVPGLSLTIPGGQQFFNMEALIIGFASGVKPPRR